jgi:uncharacterized YccA/Bax inhibitor family protein
MTVNGAMQKTGLLMAVAMAGAIHTWMQIFSGNASVAMAALATSKVGRLLRWLIGWCGWAGHARHFAFPALACGYTSPAAVGHSSAFGKAHK